jgi:hypothetical protein
MRTRVVQVRPALGLKPLESEPCADDVQLEPSSALMCALGWPWLATWMIRARCNNSYSGKRVTAA